MSKLLVNLVLYNTKALVNAYTWSTLPFYAAAQRPWTRLRRAKTLGVLTTKDEKGRTVYTRPSPPHLNHPYYKYRTISEIIPLLDRNREVIGIRDVIEEQTTLDEVGKPVVIDGKVLKKVKLSDDFRWLTVGQVMDRIDALSKGFKHLGVQKGDHVLIYAENGIEWFYSCMALARINAVTVTLFSTLSDSGVVYGMNQSDAKYVITSASLLNKIDKISDQLEHLKSIIYIRDDSKENKTEENKYVQNLADKGFTINSYDDVEANGARQPPCEFPIPKPDDLLVIMYTSGTTGNPKGVMITHEQLFQTLKNLLQYDEEHGYIVFKSIYPGYLPMGHMFGYMMNIGMFLSDSKIAFCSPFTLLDSSPAHVKGQVGDLRLIAPEFFVAVPLVLERITKEIYRKLNQVSPIAAPIFNYLIDYKIRWTSRGFDTPIINRLVSKRIRDQFGGRLKLIVVSSAALNARTQAFVQAALNVKIVQAYGSTEMTGTSHVLLMDDMSYGTTGVPWNSFKCYLKDWEEGQYLTTDKPNPRGEVVVGSVCITNGYYKMPKETDEVFFTDKDGLRWLETGDIGEILPNGTLKIIDRKKDVTKLANGEFVSLGKIESGLRNSPFIENVCVCTDPYSNHLTALISPNQRALKELAIEHSINAKTIEELCSNETITQIVLKSIRAMGNELQLKGKELPVLIKLVPEEWSQENNLLTAAMKMKRKQVNDYYREQIKQMFQIVNQTAKV